MEDKSRLCNCKIVVKNQVIDLVTSFLFLWEMINNCVLLCFIIRITREDLIFRKHHENHLISRDKYFYYLLYIYIKINR